MKLLSFIFLLSLYSCLTAQPGGVGSFGDDLPKVNYLVCGKFQLCLGYPGIDATGFEKATDFVQDTDGTMYTVGSTTGDLKEENIGGLPDIVLMKSDAQGLPLLIRQYGETSLVGDPGNGSDNPTAIAFDNSRNYLYIAGSTTGEIGEEPGMGSDPFVIKTDLAGNIFWKRQLGSSTISPTPVQMNKCSKVIGTVDGGAICIGSSFENLGEANKGSEDVLMWKLSAGGTTQWVKSFGSAGVDIATSVALSTSTNFVVAGQTTGAIEVGTRGGSGTDLNGFIAKFDLNGDVLWTKQLGTSVLSPYPASGTSTTISSLKIDATGGVHILGTMTGAGNFFGVRGGAQDLFVAKLFTSDGTVTWGKQYGEASFPAASYSDYETPFDLLVTSTEISILSYYRHNSDDEILKITADLASGNIVGTPELQSISPDIAYAFYTGIPKFRGASNFDLVGATTSDLFGTVGGISDLYVYRH